VTRRFRPFCSSVRMPATFPTLFLDSIALRVLQLSVLDSRLNCTWPDASMFSGAKLSKFKNDFSSSPLAEVLALSVALSENYCLSMNSFILVISPHNCLSVITSLCWQT